MKRVGIIIAFIGLLIFVVTFFKLTFSTNEEVMDAGNLQINHKQEHKLSWPPSVGLMVIFVGGCIFFLSKRMKST